ncbi:phage tail protein [Roseofilum reptotaenium CS-1145]|uniref:Phage tail protein n=1 Tax=Roseofilum reptotaenium AO1-A TaxID=1925591 RepID=A0A1L9QY78_9CYAN|nr:phage tail protein [Roseofilum reptotaenium]MDB9519993.1 phage tail protein [Roseofilum reptotaenium CS-1145]OJJ27606.1 phage tail protein [Roseofilum reptotaenium AO1-A]
MEYLTQARFYFEVKGITTLQLQKVSGLSMSIEPAAEGQAIYAGKNVSAGTQITPSHVSYENMTLEFVTTVENDALINWYTNSHPSSMTGGTTTAVEEAGEASLIIYKQNGQEGARYNITDAVPAKYTTTQASADSTDLFKETIEISHTGIRKVPTEGTRIAPLPTT